MLQKKVVIQQNYEQLVDWYHNDYTPNCWMKHYCYMCDSYSQIEIQKIRQQKKCKHDIGYSEETVKDLEKYQHLPKGIIQYQCETCQDNHNQINSAKNKKIQGFLLKYACELFSQEEEQLYCIFHHLTKRIIQRAYKLSQKSINKVFQLIKMWKFQREDIEYALLFEQYFHKFLQITETKKNHNDEYKLNIICEYQKCVEIEPIFVYYASISENYIAYTVKSYYLYIYDIQKDNIILVKTYFKEISQCQFTDDGRYLYINLRNSTVILEAKSGFLKTIRKRFFDISGERTGLLNLKYNLYQLKVSTVENLFVTEKYLHFSEKRNKIIAVHKTLSWGYFINEIAFDEKKCQFLYLTSSSKLVVFSIISRAIIFEIEVKNVLSLLGGNKILELESKLNRLSILTLNYESKSLERHFIDDNVECYYCEQQEQFSYNQLGENDNKWNIVDLNLGQIYSVQQKHSQFKFSPFKIVKGNKLLINDDRGNSFIKLGLRLVIMK